MLQVTLFSGVIHFVAKRILFFIVLSSPSSMVMSSIKSITIFIAHSLVLFITIVNQDLGLNPYDPV